MRVLLAVDSIGTLDMLLNETMARSWPRGTEARVISVVEDGEVSLDVWREMGYGSDAVRHEMRKRGEWIVDLAIERLRKIGIPADVTIMRGNPAFLIPFEARKWSADLLVIRAHNRRDFRNRLLGSVAKAVIGSAPCSVEVVRRTGANKALAAKSPTKILLATDGSESSVQAALEIAQATWSAGTEVKVVSIVNPVLYSLEESGLRRGARAGRAHRAIGDALQVLKATTMGITAEVIAGRPVRRIIDEATGWGATLIVVGNREQRGLKRWLLRSVSEAVASRAHCSVKIVRRRGGAQPDKFLACGPGPSVQAVTKVYELAENLERKLVA